MAAKLSSLWMGLALLIGAFGAGSTWAGHERLIQILCTSEKEVDRIMEKPGAQAVFWPRPDANESLLAFLKEDCTRMGLKTKSFRISELQKIQKGRTVFNENDAFDHCLLAHELTHAAQYLGGNKDWSATEILAYKNELTCYQNINNQHCGHLVSNDLLNVSPPTSRFETTFNECPDYIGSQNILLTDKGPENSYDLLSALGHQDWKIASCTEVQRMITLRKSDLFITKCRYSGIDAVSAIRRCRAAGHPFDYCKMAATLYYNSVPDLPFIY